MATPVEMIKDGQRQTLYGEPKLNAALADGWQRVADLSPEQQAELASRPPLPWKGYEAMTAQEVLARSVGLPPDQIAIVVAYESATKGRSSIIGKLTGTSQSFMQSAPTPVVPRRAQRSAPDDGMPVTVETIQPGGEATVRIVDSGDAPSGSTGE